MSRMRLAGLALIGLAACTSPRPKPQAAARQVRSSRESTAAAAPTQTKPIARAVTARPAPTTATHRATTTSKQPVRRTTTTHPDTTKNAVNPLTNH